MVPVSTIPAVVVKIEVSAVPYVMLSVMPQNSLAGEVVAAQVLSQLLIQKWCCALTDRCECNTASELGAVSTAESQFAIVVSR